MQREVPIVSGEIDGRDGWLKRGLGLENTGDLGSGSESY